MDECNVACSEPCIREKLDYLNGTAVANKSRALELRDRLMGATPLTGEKTPPKDTSSVTQKLLSLREILDETAGVLEGLLGKI